jgi:hypothetical protein
MSSLTRLRVYRFEPGAVFEGGLLGALERIKLSGEAKLLDTLFVTHDATRAERSPSAHSPSTTAVSRGR